MKTSGEHTYRFAVTDRLSAVNEQMRSTLAARLEKKGKTIVENQAKALKDARAAERDLVVALRGNPEWYRALEWDPADPTAALADDSDAAVSAWLQSGVVRGWIEMERRKVAAVRDLFCHYWFGPP